MQYSVSSFLAAALAAAGARAATTSAAPYTDVNTGITFNGYADGTGYQFGMVLPEKPTTDFVAQLVSPLTEGAGWAGVDFGSAMAGHLLLVAWPDGDKVMVGPRIASSYSQADVAVYKKKAIAITPIAKGTFVNDTHVSATFVCGGCIDADSFTAAKAAASGATTLSFAYSSVAVSDPSDQDTAISDHTSNGEPYGGFGFDFSKAWSSKYSDFAAMVGSGSGSSSSSAASQASSDAAPAAAASSTGSAASSNSSASSQSSSSTSSSGGDDTSTSSSSSDSSDSSSSTSDSSEPTQTASSDGIGAGEKVALMLVGVLDDGNSAQKVEIEIDIVGLGGDDFVIDISPGN